MTILLEYYPRTTKWANTHERELLLQEGTCQHKIFIDKGVTWNDVHRFMEIHPLGLFVHCEDVTTILVLKWHKFAFVNDENLKCN